MYRYFYHEEVILKWILLTNLLCSNLGGLRRKRKKKTYRRRVRAVGNRKQLLDDVAEQQLLCAWSAQQSVLRDIAMPLQQPSQVLRRPATLIPHRQPRRAPAIVHGGDLRRRSQLPHYRRRRRRPTPAGSYVITPPR